MPDHELSGALILFISSDHQSVESLRLALAQRSIRLASQADTVSLPTDLANRPPALLLLDGRRAAGPEALGTEIASLLSGQAPSTRLVALVSHDDVRLRLAALRAGAELCLVFPQAAEELAERLALLIGARKEEPDRVLVVDDQPVAALFASRVLQGAGMVTERVGDPLQVMAALERFEPHLVLMDLHMPGASGIELTSVIRGHDRFADLPIIFLSAELDPSLQIEALRIGGDDFLSKPVAPDRLVASVCDRLQRARERRRRLHGPEQRDRLTRLGTRERLLKRLDWLIGQSYSTRLAAESHALGQQRSGQRALIYLELLGDEESLEILAAEVAARIHQDDLAARVGERAVAILVWRVNHQAIAQFAQILTFQIAKALDETSMGAALGGGWYPLTGACQDSVTLLSRASKAAHLSLRRGGERIARYQPSDTDEEGLRQSKILEAVTTSRFQLLFEPMVALTGLIGERYEMTPRVAVGDGELLSPAQFLPAAIRAGLAAQFDQWLLSAGLDVLKERVDAGRPVLLFIHQTLHGLDASDWLDWVREQINRRDLIRLRPVLQFEISEADQQLELAIQRARQLNKLGIRICLNGIDFSERSMRVLHVVPSSYVRISRRVIQGPDADSIAWLIQSIKACGARVIATGVDGPASIAQLFSAGVDLIQGPYVQPPTLTMEFEFSVPEPDTPAA